MKTHILKILCAILCLALLLSCVGCTGNLQNSDNSGALDITDAPTTTLDNVWYNPGGIFRSAVFDSLLKVDADMENVSASLAEKYTVSENEDSVTLTLRENVKWHDGEAFDAEDVIFSVKAVLLTEKVNGVISSAFKHIEGADEFINSSSQDISGIIQEGNSVTFKIDGNHLNFIQALAQFAILPEHILGDIEPNEIANQDSFWNNPIGTGCYKITQAVADEYFILEANEEYFAEKAGIKKIKLWLNKTDCVTDMQSGELDFYVTNDPEEISRLKGIENCSEHRLNILFPTYLIMNLTGDNQVNKSLNDVRVRRALLVAIDREAITQAIYPGSTVTDTLIPSWDSLYYGEGEDFSFNPDGAKALLDDAGFDFSQTIRLRYSAKGQATDDLMDAIAVYWRAIGLKVDLQSFDGSGSEHMFNIRDFDVCYKRLSAFDASSIYEEVDGSEIMQESILKLPVYDTLIDEIGMTTDEEKRNELITEMQKLDQEYLLRLPLFSLANVAYVNHTRFEMPDAYGNLWYRYDLRFSEWRLK